MPFGLYTIPSVIQARGQLLRVLAVPLALSETLNGLCCVAFPSSEAGTHSDYPLVWLADKLSSSFESVPFRSMMSA